MIDFLAAGKAARKAADEALKFGFDGPLENDAMLPRELTLLPEHLRRAGYETWMVGKWHLGMASKKAAPPARGFDHFYGSLGGFLDFYTHVYFGGLDWQRNGESVDEEGHATELLTAEAVRLVNGYTQDKPFFLYLSYNAPHTPLQYPPSGGPDYAEIANADRRVFAQMTTHLDTSLKKFFDALKSRGLFENTVIVFMSDNGGNLEAGASNGQLRGGKGSALEGGVRVPTVVSWPRGIDAGQTSRQPVFAQDWLPTLLAIADASDPAREADGGTSVWEALTQSGSVSRSAPLMLGVGKSKAVYDWPYKLLRSAGNDNEAAHDSLFNVVADPLEKSDIIAEHPQIVRRLAAELDALPTTPSKGARGPTPESLFRDESGAFVYDIRMPQTREPWAESAVEE